MAKQLDVWLEQAYKCVLPTELDCKRICDMTQDLLSEEGNVVDVQSPVTVCGDIHGQFWDVLELFKHGGKMPGTSYVFMGDFVDRGRHSLETLLLLFLLKSRYPDRITLLRGNHESRIITRQYGFYDQCVRKYGNANVWKHCCEVFDFIPPSCLIDGRVFCVHGGLSPDISTLDQIRVMQRTMEVPHQGGLCDLMWSDPSDEVDTWKISPRGAGWYFGHRVTKQFSQINALELICRAHQLCQEGIKYWFEDKSLVTVWSAPNYCYRCGNPASILTFDEKLEQKVTIFQPAEDKNRPQMDTMAIEYFF